LSKILDATCNAAGLVSAEGVTVPAAEVLSEGKQASAGLLFLDGEKARYLPSSATDIKTTLEKMASALTTIATALTSIGAGMTGPTTAPPPTLAADVASIASVVTQINVLKEALK
jgi:hypothetical protein